MGVNTRAHRGDDVDALAWTLRFALGQESTEAEGGPRDWAAVLRLARLERCVGLAWLRSGRRLRADAPPVVAAEWRREVARLDDAARRQFDGLVRVVRALEAGGLHPVVLKGAPLSQLLYGDPFVRHSADLDLLLPPTEIDRAEQLLLADGWVRQGWAADERTLRSRVSGLDVILELHQSLTDDPLIAHIALPTVERARMVVEGVDLPVLPLDVLPAYLAAHLAKHTSAPALWLIDLATLWRTLEPQERSAALDYARNTSAHRMLRWALERVSHLDRAGTGDRAALRRCGGASALFREPHALRVTVATAPSLSSAVALWARWTAGRVQTLGTVPHNRLGRLRLVEAMAGRLRGVAAPAPASAMLPRHSMQLDRASSAALLRDAIASGACTWVVARGASMSPSIPSGARVRVAPFNEHGPRAGDVAVVETDAGDIVMHRILDIDDATVWLRGDNMPVSDRPVARARLIGMATHLETVDGARVLARRVPSAVRRRFWRVQRRAERLLRGMAASGLI